MEDKVVNQNPEPPAKKGRFHYGYVIVVAAFLTQVLLLIGQRGLSIALVDIQEGLGITFAEVGMISSYYGLLYAGAGFFWGWLADKIGPRYALTCAGACSAIGLFVFGLIGPNGLGYAVAAYSLVGLGCAGIYIATVPKLISAWFTPEKRGHAMRFVTPGGGLTSMLLGVVLPLGIINFGWNISFMILGVFAACVTILFFALLRNDPFEKGLTPVGAPPDAVPKPAPKAEAKKNYFIEVLKLKITWHFGIMYIAYQFAYTINSTYYVASIRAAGYGPVESGLAVTIASLFAIICMQVWGPLSDRLERKTVIALGVGGWAIVTFIYAFLLGTGTPSLLVCYIFVILMNGFFGVNTVILASMGDYFPTKYRGTGNGVVSTMSMVARYGAPIIAGMAIDAASGGVGYGLAVGAGFAVLAAFLSVSLPRLKDKKTGERLLVED